MKYSLFIFTLLICQFGFSQAPPNDNCTTPQVVVIPASGTICVNSTNINATSDLSLNACQVVGDDDVWFTYIATGVQNTITVTPNGATPAQSLVVSSSNTSCATMTYNVCNASATPGGTASVAFAYVVGTQVWVNISTNGTDGTFQVCITSTTPPPIPGGDCTTATILCNKNSFTQDPLPPNFNVIAPSCFFLSVQQPVFYQFTVGVTGTCAWLASPTGAAEYDWAMFNITGGCPGFEVGCNYNFEGGTGEPQGMQTGSLTACPTSGAVPGPTDEICPSITVFAGQTYVIMLDNFDFNNVGFNFTWGGTFQMAPTAAFTVAPSNACNAVVSTINNTSAGAASCAWNFGDGSTSLATNPPPHLYPTPGTYLISLTTTSALGCTNTTSASVTVNATPTMVAPANVNTCTGSVVPTAVLNTLPTGGTFSWTNSNPAIGLPANGTGNIPAFTAVNATTSPITATISITPIRNGCPGTAVTYTITVNPHPVLSAIANITLCAGGTVPLSNYISNVAGTTFNWTNSNPAIGLAANGTGNIPAFTATNATAVAITATISVTPFGPAPASCSGATVNYTITVNPVPTVSVAGPNQTVCGPTATLAGNAATSGAGLWTLVSGAGTITTPGSPTSGLTALGVGANVFQWTISNGICPNSSSQVTITSVAIPPVAAAGPDQPICGTVATLAGNAAAPGAGIWTLVSGAGTITAPASANSGITALGVGPNVFQWTITNAPCPTTSDQVTITGTAVPTVATANIDQVLCGNTATLAGNVAAIGVGTWTLVSGAGTITALNSPTSGLTALGLGNNVFQWTIANAPCPSTSDQVTINITYPPTPANAGPDQTVCIPSATMAANIAAVGTGLWTVVSGSGTFTTPNSPTTGVTGVGVGANVYQWTITTAAPCVPSSDQLTVTGIAPPNVANAGPDQLLCGTATTLAGNVATTGVGTWTVVFGAGVFTNANSPTTTVNGLAPGANIFQWTIANAPCPPSQDQVTVTVIAPPDVSNAGPNFSVCGTTATLTGNAPSVGIGAWTLISGTGVIANTALANSTVTGLSIGPNVFQWTITNLICPTSSSQVTITAVLAPTVATAGPDQPNVCGTTATLAGNVAAIGTGTWTLISGIGTITNPASPTTGLTGLGVGTSVYQWTITNPPCPSTQDQVSITATTPPTVSNAGPDQSICGNTATLAGNAALVGTGTWTVISGAGTFANANLPNTGVTALGAGNNVFQWSIANAPCPPSTDLVTIFSAMPPTVANAGFDSTVCGPTTNLNGNIALVGTGAWTVVSGGAIVTSPALPTSGVTGLTPGINVFQWTISNAPCPPTSDQVTITSVPLAVAAMAGPDQIICGTTATMAGNPAAPGVGAWTLISGTGVITNPALETTGITGLGVGPNIFQWTITNPPCPPTFDQVTLTGVGLPTVPNAGFDSTICGPILTALTANTPLVGTGTWTVITGTGTVTSPSNPTSGGTGLSLGANTFVWTIGNAPCPTLSDTVVITSNPIPIVANAGPDQTICANTTTLAGNPAIVGVGVWTVISGGGTLTNPNIENTTVTGLTAGVNTFQWTITDPPCPVTFDQVTISVATIPPVASAGPDQSICGTTATMAANTALPGTGAWTLISGSGTISAPNSPTSFITGLGAGPDVFQWTISNPPCPSTVDTVIINSTHATVPANAGPVQNICGLTTCTLAGNNPTSGTGTWTVVSGAGTITNPNQANSTVTGLGIGVNVFQWTFTNPPCPSTNSQVTINVGAAITVANAGPDQAVCGTTATLAGNTAVSGTGAWTLISGAGVITNPALETSGVTGLGVGANVFEWTISGPFCPVSTDQVTITAGAVPTIAAAGPDQTICGTTATLAGNIAVIGTGTWTLVSGSGTITNPALATSGITGLAVGANIFSWTISGVACPSTADSIAITVNPTQSSAFSYGAAIYCQTGANPTPVITGVAGGTFTSAPAGLIFIGALGTINVLASAVNTYTVTYTTPGPCPTSTNVSVSIIPSPIATFNYAGPYCTGGVNPNPVFGVGAIAGTFSAVPAGLAFVSTSTGQIDLATSIAGVYTVTNTLAAAGGCAAVASTANVTITATPNLIITNPPPVCAPGTVNITLAAVTAGSTGGGILSYWTNATATVPLAVPTAVAASGTYYIKSTNGGCTDIAPVVVTINISPNLIITNPAPVCAPASVDITLAAVTAGSTGGGFLTYWMDAAATIPLGGPSSITTSGVYYIEAANGTCNTIQPVIVVINPSPVALFTPDVTYGCAPLCVNFTNQSSISVVADTITSYNWNFGDGSLVSYIGPNPPPYNHCYTSQGIFTVSLTVITNAGCSNTVSFSDLIDVHTTPVASFTAPSTVSMADPTVIFNNQSTNANSWLWNFGDSLNSGGADTSRLQNPRYTYSAPGTYCTTLTAGNGGVCFSEITLCIIVEGQFALWIPNAFTPNGDGDNDEFFCKGVSVTDFQMFIYDRWGNKVFTSNSLSGHWDGSYHGKDAEEAVYVYVIYANDELHQRHKYVGSVTLVR